MAEQSGDELRARFDELEAKVDSGEVPFVDVREEMTRIADEIMARGV
jgi:hypothetical protein